MALLLLSCCKRATTFCTRIFGADAPAVTPTHLTFFTYFFWIFFALLIKNARLLIRWASFARRLELEEFFELTTNTTFACFARARTAF